MTRINQAAAERLIRNCKQYEREPKNTLNGMLPVRPSFFYSGGPLAEITCDPSLVSGEVTDISTITFSSCIATVWFPRASGGYIEIGSTTVYNPSTLTFNSEICEVEQVGARWFVKQPLRPMMIYYTLTEDLPEGESADATTSPNIGTITVALEDGYLEDGTKLETGDKGFAYRHKGGYYLLTGPCPAED